MALWPWRVLEGDVCAPSHVRAEAKSIVLPTGGSSESISALSPCNMAQQHGHNIQFLNVTPSERSALGVLDESPPPT